MTVRIEKPAFNLREKLSELDYGHVPYEKMPAGSVVQVVKILSSIQTVLSSTTTWDALGSTSAIIYPKLSDSHIIYSCTVGAEHDAASVANIYGFLKLFRSVNGATFQSLDASRMYMTESLDTSGATTTSTMNYTDEHKQPAGSKIEYKMHYHRQNSNSAIHFNQQVSTIDGVAGIYTQGFLMEIAR